MSENNNTKDSLVFAVIGIVVAVLFYRASLGLPDPVFEPVGSAYVPQIIAISAVLCAVAEIVKYLTRQRRDALSTQDSGPKGAIQWQTSFYRILFVIFFAGMVFVLDTRVVPFSLIAATLFFVTAIASGLARRKKPLILAAVIGLVLGIVLELTFTRILFIDIPTLG